MTKITVNTSSFSTKALRIMSTSHVKISQAIKGNLWHKSNKKSFDTCTRVNEKENSYSHPKKYSEPIIYEMYPAPVKHSLKSSFLLSIFWSFFHYVPDKLFHLSSFSETVRKKSKRNQFLPWNDFLFRQVDMTFKSSYKKQEIVQRWHQIFF